MQAKICSQSYKGVLPLVNEKKFRKYPKSKNLTSQSRENCILFYGGVYLVVQRTTFLKQKIRRANKKKRDQTVASPERESLN